MKRRAVLSAFVLALALTACELGPLPIDPGSGSIVGTPTVQVTGTIPTGVEQGGTVVVNGVTGDFVDPTTWTATIPMDPAGYVTVVRAVYTTPKGHTHTTVSTLVAGEAVEDGEYSPEGVGLQFTANGLQSLGPVINDLAGGSFDISGLILAQSPLIPPTDAGSGVTITGTAYEAGSEGIGLTTSATANGLRTLVQVTNLYIGMDLQLSGLISGPCKLEVEVPTTTIDATLDFSPAADPTQVDVNLVGSPAVSVPGTSYEFISGNCDPSTPIIGSIVNSAAGSAITGTIQSGFQSQIGDPDGAGPLDSPIADAIEQALSEISIAGAVGDAVQATLDAPFTQILESTSGLDFRSDADFYATIGTDPGQCAAVPGAPELTSSFHVGGAYPGLSATTPGGNPYGMGLVISSSAFNQLLSSMSECGLLNQDLHEIELLGSTFPVTSSVLGLLVPQFGTAPFPPNTPMFIRIDPQAAPFLTDAPAGPNGEMAELYLPDLRVQFVTPGTPVGEVVHLELAVDAPLGFELGYDEVDGVLQPTLTPPSAEDVTTRVVTNTVLADEETTEALFSSLFPNFVSGLASSFAAFPLPGFLGLDMEVLEVARLGNSYVLFNDLSPDPQTRIENVVTTDLSTADFATDSVLFDSREWRHRLRRQISPSGVSLNLDGMIGADACCTVDDEQANATAAGRITFDVVPEDGDTWVVDLAQSIAGAHTYISEGVGGGYRMHSTIGTLTARARIGGGAWQTFNVAVTNPNPGSKTGESGVNYHYPFTGSSSLQLTGTTAQTITVEFSFTLMALSDSNFAFPAEAGGEAAIRLGANDSLTNGFTAGDYPGVGNRSISSDGYFMEVDLTAVPAA